VTTFHYCFTNDKYLFNHLPRLCHVTKQTMCVLVVDECVVVCEGCTHPHRPVFTVSDVTTHPHTHVILITNDGFLLCPFMCPLKG